MTSLLMTRKIITGGPEAARFSRAPNQAGPLRPGLSHTQAPDSEAQAPQWPRRRRTGPGPSSQARPTFKFKSRWRPSALSRSSSRRLLVQFSETREGATAPASGCVLKCGSEQREKEGLDPLGA